MTPIALLLNLLWLFFGGLWMGAAWVLAGLIMAITIIGLPWTWAAFNIAAYTLFPFGFKAVSREEHFGQSDLALSIRENDWRASRTRSIGRVDGCGFRDDRNAFAVEEKGSGGGCRVDHGPRVVIAPVIAASMAA